MNWVGGSRNRILMKNEAKRQREFFEKRKMQQRLKELGLAVPASAQTTKSSGSMDLVTLFIVNQIAAKKDNKDPPKVAVLGSYKGGTKHKRAESLALPMSPCSPSQLSLVESQPQHSVQGARKRKHFIPQGFNCGQKLSPVLESAFSDNSASDYVPPLSDHLSPFSSTSSSSGQAKFPLQLNPQTSLSPAPWDTSGREQAEFQTFSQSKGMMDSITWLHGANPPIYHLETPTAPQAFFRSPDPNNTVARNHARQEDSCCLGQMGRELQFEGDVFTGFCTDQQSSYCETEKPKIYLQDEAMIKSSAPQTVPDSQQTGGGLSNCTDMDFLCLEHHSVPLNSCDCVPSYSCSGGYLSSDSDDAASSYMDQACCVDSVNTNQGSRENPKQRQSSTFNLIFEPKANSRDDQKVMENMASKDKASESSSQQTGSSTAQKTFRKSQDAGTQTVISQIVKTQEASSQCCFFGGDIGFNLWMPTVDVSVQDQATGGRTDTTTTQSHTQVSGKTISGVSEKKSRAGSPIGSSFLNKREGKLVLQRPKNSLNSLDQSDKRDLAKRSREGADGKNGHLMEAPSIQARQEVTATSRVNRLANENETLQEIADILLLLKQRKEEGW